MTASISKECVSERFGIPDHSPQPAPDHAAQNPTAQGSPMSFAPTPWFPSRAGSRSSSWRLSAGESSR
jgi:hypothetical protein